MSVSITLTYDLEDPRPSRELEQRFDRTTREVADEFDALGLRCTFFVVGTAAKTAPKLISDLASRGHEIALHSWDHTMLPDQTAPEFREETRRGKQTLEDLIGSQVVGYRAPNFSLTPNSRWAIAELVELGFDYSSSVLPIAHPFYGYDGLPHRPFRWQEGLTELPAPVASWGPLKLPYLGGVYFRYLPRFLIRRELRRADENECLWSYFHPHDFDRDEPFYRIKNISTLVSLVLWFRRSATMPRLRWLVEQSDVRVLPTFKDQLSGLRDLPVVA